eukprot:m.24616 g.24616  ORF g.24616 m.24616 type:complete len:762 (+) comp4037_c0_seq1:45-2330(+)
MAASKPVSAWAPDDVYAWLGSPSIKLGQYSQLFLDNCVDGFRLLHDGDDASYLKEISRADRKILKKHVSLLRLRADDRELALANRRSLSLNEDWSVLRDGLLLKAKKSKGILSSTNLRRFVLLQEKHSHRARFDYYEGKTLHGTIDLSQFRVTAVPGSAAFEITTPDRVLHLLAEHNNMAEAHAWVLALQQLDVAPPGARLDRTHSTVLRSRAGIYFQMGDELLPMAHRPRRVSSRRSLHDVFSSSVSPVGSVEPRFSVGALDPLLHKGPDDTRATDVQDALDELDRCVEAAEARDSRAEQSTLPDVFDSTLNSTRESVGDATTGSALNITRDVIDDRPAVGASGSPRSSDDRAVARLPPIVEDPPRAASVSPQRMMSTPTQLDRYLSIFSSPTSSLASITPATSAARRRREVLRRPALPQRRLSLRVVSTRAIPVQRVTSYEEGDVISGPPLFRLADLQWGPLIGEGYFGRVFRCGIRSSAVTVVVKVLKDSDPTARIAFVKEVSLLKTLSHPNVLRFIGLFATDQKLHLVTEYIEGGTLHNIIINSSGNWPSLPWDLRMRFSQDIARGMKYLHARRVIHRDLKSDNCLIRTDLTAVVADFGLARVMEDAEEERRLVTAVPGSGRLSAPTFRPRYMSVVGSAYWMAPELMLGKQYNEAVDVFSFGIVMCELIGRVEADPDIMPRLSNFGVDELLFKRDFAGGCPQDFLSLAMLCCAVDPKLRPSFVQCEATLRFMRLVQPIDLSVRPVRSAPTAPAAPPV